MIGNKDLLAANRYAAALFELAVADRHDIEMQAELTALSSALKKSPHLEKFFHNPYFSTEEKEKLLDKLYKKDGSTPQTALARFLKLLLEKNRFDLIHEIVESFKRVSSQSHGEAVAEVRTAAPLNSQSELALVSRLEKMTSVKITVKKEIDPALIGGVSVRIKNKVWDGTVRSQIDLFKRELTKINTI